MAEIFTEDEYREALRRFLKICDVAGRLAGSRRIGATDYNYGNLRNGKR